MPNLRKALITVFATGTVLAISTAPHALAATHAPAAAVQDASARQVAAGEYASTSVTAAPAKVHRAACTSLTFNVYHDHALRPLCYAETRRHEAGYQGCTRDHRWPLLGLPGSPGRQNDHRP